MQIISKALNHSKSQKPPCCNTSNNIEVLYIVHFTVCKFLRYERFNPYIK